MYANLLLEAGDECNTGQFLQTSHFDGSLFQVCGETNKTHFEVRSQLFRAIPAVLLARS